MADQALIEWADKTMVQKWHEKHGVLNNRSDKIKAFFTRYRPYWCPPGACACMGCYNKSSRTDWNKIYPEEENITEDEINEFNQHNP